MSRLLIPLFCLLNLYSFSQRSIDVNKAELKPGGTNIFFVVSGEPFVTTKFTKVVDGSPYFKDNWMKGTVVINGGYEYNNVFLKLELLDNELHYRDSTGTEIVASTVVQQVKLYDTVNERFYRFVHSAFINATKIERGWYQLLSEGARGSIFKQYKKTISENQPYGSATVEQYITTAARYFLLVNGEVKLFYKLKELPALLPDKKQELLKYISDHNLSGKSDDDFAELMTYYNSLQ